MSGPQTTPLSALLNKEDRPPQMAPQMPPPNQDPSGQFGQLPARPPIMQVTNQMPGGVGQGMSMPEGASRKEFFGLKELDYKSIILVFAIILILSSGMFSSCVRPYVPGAVGSDGKTTLVGSLIAAIVGVLIFVIVKFFGKF
jgi:hypothetical protein